MIGSLVWIGILVFVVTAGLGFVGLPILRSLNIGQHERSKNLVTHQVKSGTPTIGGIIFIVPIVILGIILGLQRPGSGILPVTLFVLGMGIVGFVDDYVKVRINKVGLSEFHKSIAIALIILIFAVWYVFGRTQAPYIMMPFTGELVLITGIWRYLYVLFVLFYFFACTNAVNVTDGVDGLCASVTSIVGIFIMIASVHLSGALAQHGLTALYEGQAILGVMLLAGCLGFFVHNYHVARMFMGDTGSLALGAMASAVMLMQGIPWAFIVAGIIYVIEIGSVVIQRTSLKFRNGKKIWRFTPIHHHFELIGWSEWKIVIVFTLIAIIGAAVATWMIWV